MRELLQKIYELILGLLGPVIEWLRELWEMPAEDFLASLFAATWAVGGFLLKWFGIFIAVVVVWAVVLVTIRAIYRAIIQAIDGHRERSNRS